MIADHVLVIVAATTAWAQDDGLETLGRRYEAQKEKYRKASETATTEKERHDLILSADVRNVFVDDLLSIEAEHRDQPTAVSALYKLLKNGTSTSDPQSRASQGRVRAIEVLRQHYIDHPDLDLLLTGFEAGAFVPEAELLLRGATHSPHRYVRAAACYFLARFLCHKRYLIEHFQCLEERPLSDAPAEAAEWRRVLRGFIERMKPINVQQWRDEAIRLCDEIKLKYPEERIARVHTEGTGRLRVRRKSLAELPDRKPPTFATLAERLRFELTNLQTGDTAPEIVGIDANGMEFKLSDYRGRVVLLIFSAGFCGPCRGLCSDIRELQQQFANQPFEVLGVVEDPEPKPVTQAIKDGTIRWRIWLDGPNKVIARQWNVNRIPTLYLLDQNGVIRLSRHTVAFDILERRIRKLLAARSRDERS